MSRLMAWAGGVGVVVAGFPALAASLAFHFLEISLLPFSKKSNQ